MTAGAYVTRVTISVVEQTKCERLSHGGVSGVGCLLVPLIDALIRVSVELMRNLVMHLEAMKQLVEDECDDTCHSVFVN